MAIKKTELRPRMAVMTRLKMEKILGFLELSSLVGLAVFMSDFLVSFGSLVDFCSAGWVFTSLMVLGEVLLEVAGVFMVLDFWVLFGLVLAFAGVFVVLLLVFAGFFGALTPSRDLPGLDLALAAEAFCGLVFGF